MQTMEPTSKVHHASPRRSHVSLRHVVESQRDAETKFFGFGITNRESAMMRFQLEKRNIVLRSRNLANLRPVIAKYPMADCRLSRSRFPGFVPMDVTGAYIIAALIPFTYAPCCVLEEHSALEA